MRVLRNQGFSFIIPEKTGIYVLLNLVLNKTPLLYILNVRKAKEHMIKSKLFGLLFGLVGICLSSCNQNISKSNLKNYYYIQDNETVSYLTRTLTSSVGGDPGQPLNFHETVLYKYQMVLTECNFDYKNSTGKIAITLSRESIDIISSTQEGEKWGTINPLITTMLSGCEEIYDVRSDLKFVRFNRDEKVPCQIDGRYVVALYYEGEELLIEEITQGIKGNDKRVDYCFASAVEGDDGFMNETIPESYSVKRFCVGSNLIDEGGHFFLNKTSIRMGELIGNTLTTNSYFFSNIIDKLGTITPLINGDSINYEDFKRVVPDYTAYYQSDEFVSKKNVPFIERIHEFQNENNSIGHVAYLFEDYSRLASYISQKPFVEEFVAGYDEAFFASNDIIIVGDFHSAHKYYELFFESITLQRGYITVSVKKEYTVGKRGSSFSIAELSKNDLATLENEYISYSVIE